MRAVDKRIGPESADIWKHRCSLDVRSSTAAACVAMRRRWAGGTTSCAEKNTRSLFFRLPARTPPDRFTYLLPSLWASCFHGYASAESCMRWADCWLDVRRRLSSHRKLTTRQSAGISKNFKIFRLLVCHPYRGTKISPQSLTQKVFRRACRRLESIIPQLSHYAAYCSIFKSLCSQCHKLVLQPKGLLLWLNLRSQDDTLRY